MPTTSLTKTQFEHELNALARLQEKVVAVLRPAVEAFLNFANEYRKLYTLVGADHERRDALQARLGIDPYQHQRFMAIAECSPTLSTFKRALPPAVEPLYEVARLARDSHGEQRLRTAVKRHELTTTSGIREIRGIRNSLRRKPAKAVPVAAESRYLTTFDFVFESDAVLRWDEVEDFKNALTPLLAPHKFRFVSLRNENALQQRIESYWTLNGEAATVKKSSTDAHAVTLQRRAVTKTLAPKPQVTGTIFDGDTRLSPVYRINISNEQITALNALQDVNVLPDEKSAARVVLSRQPLVAEVIEQDGQPGTLGAPLTRGALVLSLTQQQAKALSVLLKSGRLEPSSRGRVSPLLQVSDTTRRVLKNFGTISDSVLLVEGKRQKTVTQSRAVLAIAEFPDAWLKATGIHKMSRFRSALSVFENPTLDFEDDAMVVTDADKRGLSIRYRCSDPSTIVAIGDKTFPKHNPAVEFMLSTGDLSFLKERTSQMSMPAFAISVKNGIVTIVGKRAKNSRSKNCTIVIPKSDVTLRDKSFGRSLLFKVEHLGLLLDGNYIVALSDWRYAYLTNQDVPVSYYVTEQVPD